MKTLSNIRYILFALLILGSFANFAQNDYGLVIVDLCNLFLALSYLVSVIWYGKQSWEEKKSSLFFVALALLCFLIIAIANLFGNPENGIIPFEFVMLFLLGIMVVESVLVMVFNRKTPGLSNRFMTFESLAFFLALAGYYLKSLHWAGASPLIICGSVALLLIYVYQLIRSLFKKQRKGKLTTIFSFLFYLNIAIASVAYAFKFLHWPMGGMFCMAASFLLLLILIPVLFNSKFSYLTEKISARKYIKNRGGLTMFIFVYLNYFTVYIALQNIGVGPKYYSLNRPPAYQKLLEKSSGDESPEARIYMDNYDTFLDHRRAAENK